ncbi:DUF333 domain-containing protein [Shimia sp.]|uniref:DUF333 domain-containing protein n=1 Tax=Shimia sp. TaxID=1954381 RepID=UPI003299602C
MKALVSAGLLFGLSACSDTPAEANYSNAAAQYCVDSGGRHIEDDFSDGKCHLRNGNRIDAREHYDYNASRASNAGAAGPGGGGRR